MRRGEGSRVLMGLLQADRVSNVDGRDLRGTSFFWDKQYIDFKRQTCFTECI